METASAVEDTGTSIYKETMLRSGSYSSSSGKDSSEGSTERTERSISAFDVLQKAEVAAEIIQRGFRQSQKRKTRSKRRRHNNNNGVSFSPQPSLRTHRSPRASLIATASSFPYPYPEKTSSSHHHRSLSIRSKARSSIDRPPLFANDDGEEDLSNTSYSLEDDEVFLKENASTSGETDELESDSSTKDDDDNESEGPGRAYIFMLIAVACFGLGFVFVKALGCIAGIFRKSADDEGAGATMMQPSGGTEAAASANTSSSNLAATSAAGGAPPPPPPSTEVVVQQMAVQAANNAASSAASGVASSAAAGTSAAGSALAATASQLGMAAAFSVGVAAIGVGVGVGLAPDNDSGGDNVLARGVELNSTCGLPNPDFRQGSLTLVLQGYNETFTPTETSIVENILVDVYNEYVGGCNSTFDRFFQSAPIYEQNLIELDDVATESSASALELWFRPVVECIGCLAYEPLFATESLESGDFRRKLSSQLHRRKLQVDAGAQDVVTVDANSQDQSALFEEFLNRVDIEILERIRVEELPDRYVRIYIAYTIRADGDNSTNAEEDIVQQVVFEIVEPSLEPSLSAQPSEAPSAMPTLEASLSPTLSTVPSSYPSAYPSVLASSSPSESIQPSASPSHAPSVVASSAPSESAMPSDRPSAFPTPEESLHPTLSKQPSMSPSSNPSVSPSSMPTVSAAPSLKPSSTPSVADSDMPSISVRPSTTPSMSPSRAPSELPSVSKTPSTLPSWAPTQTASSAPSYSSLPSGAPSSIPSETPSISPSLSFSPTECGRVELIQPIPVVGNSDEPIIFRFLNVSTAVGPISLRMNVEGDFGFENTKRASIFEFPECQHNSTISPSNVGAEDGFGCPDYPEETCILTSTDFNDEIRTDGELILTVHVSPSVNISGCFSNSVAISIEYECGIESISPTEVPTRLPSISPSISLDPSSRPSGFPSATPSLVPSGSPSRSPSSPPSSSIKPSESPSQLPSLSSIPSIRPTDEPSESPTELSSSAPSLSGLPSVVPSLVPSRAESNAPTLSSSPSSTPTKLPSTKPSSIPSLNPSLNPTLQPSSFPSSWPSYNPSGQPSQKPSMVPTVTKSEIPSDSPTASPSTRPSLLPSYVPSLEPSVMPTACGELEQTQAITSATGHTVDNGGSPLTFFFASVPEAMGPITIKMDVRGDFGAASERATLEQFSGVCTHNGPSGGSGDCIEYPTEECNVPAADFNSLVSPAGDLTLTVDVSAAVNVVQCSESFVTLSLVYECPGPTGRLSMHPSLIPSARPSHQPSFAPSKTPTVLPSELPTMRHSQIPSHEPSRTPTDIPSGLPSQAPSQAPTPCGIYEQVQPITSFFGHTVFNGGEPLLFSFLNIPNATGDVLVSLDVRGDFGDEAEKATLLEFSGQCIHNGPNITGAAGDCVEYPPRQCTIPASEFNNEINENGDLQLSVDVSAAVNVVQCEESYVGVSLSFDCDEAGI